MPRRLRGPERMTRPHSSRRCAGPALALTLALAACTPTITGGWDESGTGYVSGDRSVTTWDPADRTGPVEIAGTDFAGNPVDLADWRGAVGVVHGRVGDLEGALEGLGGPGGVGGVDAQQVHAVLGIVGGERHQVRRLRTARRAGGIPGVEHDDV